MSAPRQLLILAHIWPEAAASAASTRLLDLISSFQAAGFTLTVSADGRENGATEALRERGCVCVRMAPNDSSFDPWLQALNPELVLFDRFTTEEKFAWRVRALCPQALRVLDTIDLHFLRSAREKVLKAGLTPSWEELLRAAGDIAPREVAAIYRSDLSLIVSELELKLLHERCGVPLHLLHLCRLYYPQPGIIRPLADRQGFSMIGNFKHPPNVDAVLYLRDELWPSIRARLPEAVVHIWGSYATPGQLAWSNPKRGFIIEGYVADQFAALGSARVNLAPLRFGAGIKGKIADGWWAGTPAVTMPVGAEGMHEDLPFGGIIAGDNEAFVAAACALYQDEGLWQKASEAGRAIIAQLYSEAATTQALHKRLNWLLEHRDAERIRNFTGSILWQQSMRSTEYFSRWIEAKNSK